MTTRAAETLQEIEQLRLRLMEPIDEEMRSGGWRQESATSMAGVLEELAAKIRLVGEIPPKSERPWDMIRGLDSLGIHGGGPFDDLLALGHKLREDP